MVREKKHWSMLKMSEYHKDSFPSSHKRHKKNNM